MVHIICNETWKKKVQNRVHKTYNMLVCHVDNRYCIIIFFFFVPMRTTMQKWKRREGQRDPQRRDLFTTENRTFVVSRPRTAKGRLLSCVFRHVTHDERCSVPICTAKPPSPCVVYHVFLRITQYNADAHNTHAHSPLWMHVRKP
jgi:hypothetical protein